MDRRLGIGYELALIMRRLGLPESIPFIAIAWVCAALPAVRHFLLLPRCNHAFTPVRHNLFQVRLESGSPLDNSRLAF